MRKHICAGLLIGGLAAGCGDSSPSQPTPNPGGNNDGPTARLTVNIDSLGSREAVTGLSDVTVDASESSGTGLTYRIDFGDGTTATQAVARHVYSATGTFTATVTITDASGRTSSAFRQVVVTSPVSTWVYSGYLTRARRVEVRTLALTTQDGHILRGFLGATGERDRQITGTLSGERAVQLVVDDQSETLKGLLPSVLSSESSRLELVAHGGPADGERLDFVPLRGEPSGPPPDAVLKMRFFSFAAPFAVQGFSPILFDGSTSRGDGLRYFIEFGDREVTTEPSAVHPIANANCPARIFQPCRYTARLTVVDRSGRWDQEALPFEVRSLVTMTYYHWEGADGDLGFSSQDGPNVTGGIAWRQAGGWIRGPSFTGTLSGERDIRLVLHGSNIVLAGTLSMSSPYGQGWRLRLTQTGGPDHGKTYDFGFRWGY